jgi:hypothetical protein
MSSVASGGEIAKTPTMKNTVEFELEELAAIVLKNYEEASRVCVEVAGIMPEPSVEGNAGETGLSGSFLDKTIEGIRVARIRVQESNKLLSEFVARVLE